MGSIGRIFSGTGIGETLKKKARITPEAAAGAVVGAPAALAGQVAGGARKARQAEKEAAGFERGAQAGKEIASQAEEKREAAEASVREQARKARLRTTFAGGGIRESLFRRLLTGQRGGQRRRLLGG